MKPKHRAEDAHVDLMNWQIHGRLPQAVWAKDRVSLSETLAYFEFLVQQVANAQKSLHDG